VCIGVCVIPIVCPISLSCACKLCGRKTGSCQDYKLYTRAEQERLGCHACIMEVNGLTPSRAGLRFGEQIQKHTKMFVERIKRKRARIDTSFDKCRLHE